MGWYVPGTGLTRVLSNLLSHLAARWEVHLAGVGYQGPPVESGGFVVHPTEPSGRDTFGAHAARGLVAELDPQVVLCHHDLWILPRYVKLLGPVCDRARLVAYTPIDGRVLDESLVGPLLGFDLVMVYTEWARRQVQTAWDRLGVAERPQVEILAHGVDQQTFRPDQALIDSGFAPAARVGARQRLLPGLPRPESAFVVLNPSRPALRKRLDLTLEGFARFAVDLPDNVRLCLHQAVSDSTHEQEMSRLIRRLGLGSRLIRSPLGAGVASDRDLADLYRACDVGLNTSMGEGWGLVSFEHAAAGGAQVVPGHSACGELWKGRAEIIEVSRRLVPRFSPLELAEVDPDGVAKALDRLYRDPEHLSRISRAGHDLAHQPGLAWSAVGERLELILSDRLPSAEAGAGG